MNSGEIPTVPLRNPALVMPELKIVVPTRTRKLDNDLVESGPPAMLTSKSILLIYNGRITKSGGDSSVANVTYGGGEYY